MITKMKKNVKNWKKINLFQKLKEKTTHTKNKTKQKTPKKKHKKRRRRTKTKSGRMAQGRKQLKFERNPPNRF